MIDDVNDGGPFCNQFNNCLKILEGFLETNAEICTRYIDRQKLTKALSNFY